MGTSAHVTASFSQVTIPKTVTVLEFPDFPLLGVTVAIDYVLGGGRIIIGQKINDY